MKQAVGLLIGAVVLGGVVYVATKKKEGTETTAPGSNVPGLPDYVPQELVDAYTKCYNQGCSFEEYKEVQTALAGLLTQHPELAPTWNYFMQELQKKVPVQSPQLPTDFDIKMTYQPQVDTCWYYACNIENVTQLAESLQQVYFEHVLDHPSVATQVNDVMNQIRYWYGLDVPEQWLNGYLNRSTAGVSRHVAGCGCQSCQEEEERSTGACCASCALGQPCEGCESEPEERGVG